MRVFAGGLRGFLVSSRHRARVRDRVALGFNTGLQMASSMYFDSALALVGRFVPHDGESGWIRAQCIGTITYGVELASALAISRNDKRPFPLLPQSRPWLLFSS